MPPDLCEACGWVLDQLGVCTNRRCETLVQPEPVAEVVPTTEIVTEHKPVPFNRAERRGNAIGRYSKAVPHRARVEGLSARTRTDADRARTKAQRKARKKNR